MNSPGEVLVALDHAHYPIYISPNCISPRNFSHIQHKRVLIVSNETIAPLYLSQVEQLLLTAGFDVSSCILPDGEAFKNYETLMKVYDILLENKFSRNSTIAALGGGVIGDMAGFIAATYQRGIDFIQVPTTLLACVDSSVGGKTGINHPAGKNMIGAFYQPKSVFINPNFLTTLPENEYRAGVAEIIKYGCIIDSVFFKWLEQNIDALMAREEEALMYAIQRSCELKSKVVALDEKETSGVRALLNFGHTFGHAIEAVQHYKGLKHGEAVAVGMVIASLLSQALGRLTKDSVDRVFSLIERAGLPTSIPNDVNRESFWEAMLRDKKNDQGNVRYILLNQIGEAELVSGISKAQVDPVLDHFF